MSTFESFYLQKAYEESISFMDKLPEMEQLINWEMFRPLISAMYENKSSKGGRPNIDEVVMLKTLFLQSLYGLSDPQLEFQIKDRLSFRNFLGLEKNLPDFTTIWRFRERLAKNGMDSVIWGELWSQLKSKGIVVKRGVIQDASIIHSPVGRKRIQKEKKVKNEGRKPHYTKQQKSQIDEDSTFTVKRKQIYHGHKLHIKVDMDYGFIHKFDVTTASVHDSQIDLVEPDDVCMARDKGYFGVPLKHPNVKNLTIKRASRNKPLTKEEKRINRLISRVRSPVERPFAIIKNVFHRDSTYYKRSHRVRVQQMFNCFSFNIYHLYHCSRRGVIA